ncbi:hypothetical protein H7849_11930 [Alloacidobacterium dinghuense]|uniref:Uncharacterized protein n=1 Tax=Alloacidobacterium dinghuense TaxID=2763107 RepID=A0A7G8BPR5_9BACT|nr:phage tail tube protein [Alloacidobacterium dinghuense]QNI34535.1 hypothetical protein H7849_11930 [Alloacidobacterium dinghuense]
MPGPYNFEAQPSWLRNLVLAAAKQPAWGTGLTTSLTQRQRFDGATVLERSISRRSDKDYAGKGTSFATNGQITTHDTKLDGFKAELSDWLVGYIFAFLMGKETVTGTGAPYTHTFTFDESTRTAVATSIYVEDTNDVHYTCPDMCINDLTLTISEIGAIMAEMSMMGTGLQTMGSIATLPNSGTDTYLLGSDAALSFGPVGSPASFIGRHMKTTLKLDNQLTVHKAPGGGLYGIFVRKGDPKFSIATTIAAKPTDDVYTLFTNDTPSAFTLNVNSGAAAQLNISIPQTHLKTTKLGLDGDMVVWEIEGDETTCYQAAGVPPITIQAINSVAAYLTPGT